MSSCQNREPNTFVCAGRSSGRTWNDAAASRCSSPSWPFCFPLSSATYDLMDGSRRSGEAKLAANMGYLRWKVCYKICSAWFFYGVQRDYFHNYWNLDFPVSPPFLKANWAIQNESSRLLLFPSGSTRFYLSLDLRGGAYSQTGRTEPITGLRDTKQKTEKQVFRVPFGWHQLHRIFKHNFSVPVGIQRNFSDPNEDCTK